MTSTGGELSWFVVGYSTAHVSSRGVCYPYNVAPVIGLKYTEGTWTGGVLVLGCRNRPTTLDTQTGLERFVYPGSEIHILVVPRRPTNNPMPSRIASRPI